MAHVKIVLLNIVNHAPEGQRKFKILLQVEQTHEAPKFLPIVKLGLTYFFYFSCPQGT